MIALAAHDVLPVQNTEQNSVWTEFRVVAAGPQVKSLLNFEKDPRKNVCCQRPYLTSNQRPTITFAPSAVTYGQLFTVSSPYAQTIQVATWIRLSSVTHGFNQNQRLNVLPIESRGSGTLSIRAPLTPQESPPGHYMLFIVNGAGTPSVAKVIQIPPQ